MKSNCYTLLHDEYLNFVRIVGKLPRSYLPVILHLRNARKSMNTAENDCKSWCCKVRHYYIFTNVLKSLSFHYIISPYAFDMFFQSNAILDNLHTLSGETLSGESDEFFEKWWKFRPTSNSARRKFRPTKFRPPM